MKNKRIAALALLVASAAANLTANLGAFAEPPRAEESTTARSKYVRVEGFADPSAVERECDAVLRRLFERYGVPRRWRRFPVRFSSRPGGAIAGYTSYVPPNVVETVIYQSFEEARGGTLDHELTHAFFFYLLESDFDLFFNEGVAQNSEYAKREELRREVARRLERRRRAERFLRGRESRGARGGVAELRLRRARSGNRARRSVKEITREF